LRRYIHLDAGKQAPPASQSVAAVSIGIASIPIKA
jgi:hypothetical protein